jgi:hypothetical protein
MGSWLTSILQGTGRAGNELSEAKYANLQDKQQLDKWKMQQQEIQQRLATEKAPQVVHTYQASDGKMHNIIRNPLDGKLTDQAVVDSGEMSPDQKKITDAEKILGPLSKEQKETLVGLGNKGKAKYADPKLGIDGKWWGLNIDSQRMERIPGQEEFQAAQKPQNRDDKYIAIQQKKSGGTPLSKDDKDYEAAWDLWTKKTKIDPGVSRAAAFGANHYIQILNPEHPEDVNVMRAYDAAKMGRKTPQSISFQIDKFVTKYFTAGPAGTTVNYFNTTIDHMKLLRETVNGLQNGDVQLFNKWGNAWANATGNPAPNDFNTVRSAVSGELSKTFKGTGATDQEVALIEGTINNSQSPQQLFGAINYYLRLMDGKMTALKGQYTAGKQGTPNFPNGGATNPNTGTPPPGAKIIKWDDVK